MGGASDFSFDPFGLGNFKVAAASSSGTTSFANFATSTTTTATATNKSFGSFTSDQSIKANISTG